MDGDAVPVSRGRPAATTGSPRSATPTPPSTPGDHVYGSATAIDGVLDPGTNGSQRPQFYWNLIPARLGAGHLRGRPDRPPAGGRRGRPVRGRRPTTGGCQVEGAGTKTCTSPPADLAAAHAGDAQDRAGHGDPAAGGTLPWPRAGTPCSAAASPLGCVVVLVVRSPRCARALPRRQRAARRTPASRCMYAPPEGIGPAQAAYLVSEQVDDEQYVATLMYAAEKGAIDLDRGRRRLDDQGQDTAPQAGPVSTRSPPASRTCSADRARRSSPRRRTSRPASGSRPRSPRSSRARSPGRPPAA